MDKDIRAEHERRLKQLQIKAARMGINTPAEVLSEIEDIEKKLLAADNAATATPSSKPVPHSIPQHNTIRLPDSSTSPRKAPWFYKFAAVNIPLGNTTLSIGTIYILIFVITMILFTLLTVISNRQGIPVIAAILIGIIIGIPMGLILAGIPKFLTWLVYRLAKARTGTVIAALTLFWSSITVWIILAMIIPVPNINFASAIIAGMMAGEITGTILVVIALLIDRIIYAAKYRKS